MNNDRGKSLQIPQSTLLKEGSIYVATLHSVTETDYSGDIKHQFTYEIEIDQQIFYVNRSVVVNVTHQQLSLMTGSNVIVTIAQVMKTMSLILIRNI